jgi:PAS domain S-box
LSIKTKLSVSISLLTLLVIAAYHVVSEYTIIKGIRETIDQSFIQISEQVAETLAGRLNGEPPSGGEEPADIGQTYRVLNGIYPTLKEITVFDVQSSGVPYGTYAYIDAINDWAIAQAAKPGKLTVHETEIDGVPYIRTFYTTRAIEGYVVSMMYENAKPISYFAAESDRILLYASATFALLLAVTYWLVGFMIRPLTDILWKVNEVSSVRFHKPILIKRKDEFGLLALKINAMSQNLGIYMNKLRKAFEENRRMKDYLESFINHSNDAIYIMDLDGKILQVNRAFEGLFGYEESEVLGSRYPVVPDTHRMEKRQMLGLLMAGKKLPPQETVRVTKTGELIPVNETISPIRDPDGTIKAFASICRDMRSRNRMEELLRRSEKLTTVGQLAAGVAHEIRNPLTTLRGFLQLQQQSGKLNLSHVDLMLSELDRINLIVGEFLILAKPQATKFVTKDVRDVMQDVLRFLDSEAHLHNIVFKTVYTEESCAISCEENQLKQVFINLLKNAIEAMPGGGNVHISVQRKGDRIAISITDEGIGIPEEMISKIGDPFFTGKETGTGLGIMVSQRIINSHQGTLDIQSQVNVGTSVKLTLPALKEEEEKGILKP